MYTITLRLMLSNRTVIKIIFMTAILESIIILCQSGYFDFDTGKGDQFDPDVRINPTWLQRWYKSHF